MDSNNPAEASEKEIDAVLWFMEHPDAFDAMKDEVLQAYIRHIKERVESEEAGLYLPPLMVVK